MQEDKLDMEIGGTLQQRISSCLQELDPLISDEAPIVGSMVVAEKRARGSDSGGIVNTVLGIMSLKDLKTISMDSTLSDLGMDSLMAVEIKQTLEREFEVFLSPQDLRALTFLKLQELEAQRETMLVNTETAPETEKPAIVLGQSKDMGEAMLFRSFGDEENCFETILRLHSKDDNNNYHTAALLVPGVEGVAGDVYRQLSTSLNASTFILQLTNARNKGSIREIAEAVFKVGNYTSKFLVRSLQNSQFQFKEIFLFHFTIVLVKLLVFTKASCKLKNLLSIASFPKLH